jgi:aspartyl-tRNA(Asn)/glutamyl-tRNA(Gln) amidotransferase subunit A
LNTQGIIVIDTHRLGITELRSAFARDALSPTVYVADLLDRIDRFNPELKAFIEIDRAGAMAAAEVSTQRFSEDSQRPLEGIAIGIKANIAVRGVELSAGMAARSGMIAEEDSAAVARLRDAGAVILGTLNMHEAALGATTDNPFFGRCINPHGEGLTPGGSSGGSGSAVAAGLCTAALGTDTLGSIRIPAAYCGVFGLKPTHGALSDQGLVPLCQSLDAIGPLARSMDDISFLSNTLFAPDLASAMQRARFLTLDDLGGVKPDVDVAEAYNFALALLPQRAESFHLNSDCGRIRLAGFAIAARELATHLVKLGPDRCAQISDETGALIDFGISRGESDLAQDIAMLADTKRRLLDQIGANGILVLPTAPQVAFPQGSRAPANQADWTSLANIAGLPAITLPIGRNAQGMPIGMQLIGPPNGEALLVAQARAVNDRIKAYTPPATRW